jgi:glyoxylase-like metal-dependent hydrolase (beta-lactamase superfamily II)
MRRPDPIRANDDDRPIRVTQQNLQQESSDSTPCGRVNHELSELDNGLSFVEAFSNSVNFATDDGLVVIDTSSFRGGQKVVDAIHG